MEIYLRIQKETFHEQFDIKKMTSTGVLTSCKNKTIQNYI